MGTTAISPAEVEGIKPYEIIIHVNDKPVTGVKNFEKFITSSVSARRVSHPGLFSGYGSYSRTFEKKLSASGLATSWSFMKNR